MGRLGWLFVGVIGFGLLLLIINHDTGRTLGLPNDSFAHVLYTGVWASAIALGFFGSGFKLGDVIRQGLIWLVIFLALVAGYQYRFELQDMGNRLSAGLIPASPFTVTDSNGNDAVKITRSIGGSFRINALVNGERINFLVDTGATDTVLAYHDALAVGIQPDALTFNRPVNTANGQTFSARARVNLLKIGPIELDNFSVSVAQEGDLGTSLLGMTMLNQLSGFSVRGDQLQLFP